MWTEVKKHIIHYLVLFAILGLGLWGFWFFSYRAVAQIFIILAVAVLYVLWGMAHHYLENNLNFKIVVEYTAMAALASTVLIIMINGSS